MDSTMGLMGWIIFRIVGNLKRVGERGIILKLGIEILVLLGALLIVKRGSPGGRILLRGIKIYWEKRNSIRKGASNLSTKSCRKKCHYGNYNSSAAVGLRTTIQIWRISWQINTNYSSSDNSSYN
jgi:hypothetical protein